MKPSVPFGRRVRNQAQPAPAAALPEEPGHPLLRRHAQDAWYRDGRLGIPAYMVHGAAGAFHVLCTFRPLLGDLAPALESLRFADLEQAVEAGEGILALVTPENIRAADPSRSEADIVRFMSHLPDDVRPALDDATVSFLR